MPRRLLENLPATHVAVLEAHHPLGHTRDQLRDMNERLGGKSTEEFDAHLDRSLRLGLMVELPNGCIATSWIGWAAYRYGYATNLN